MIILDTEVREDILNANGSIVVSASAGSGKTTIMIKKIIKKTKEISDHRRVAAITFTLKATEEIRKKAVKLGSNSDIIVMTNDSFIEYEIIRPFITDAFGPNYRNDFIVSYNNSLKFRSFEKGLELLKTKKILATYKDNRKNLKFELAKKIMERSEAAREYFKSKYEMLFLDEYQDSDLDMHNLFMYIKNQLNIDLFIVGDSKQAIYLWRGAQRDIFSLLKDENMSSYELTTNFRSHIEIVNYANLAHNKSHFNSNYTEEVERVIHCKTSDFVQSFVTLNESAIIDIKKDITIIANINEDAKNISDSLNNAGFNFIFIPRTPLDIGSENSAILKGLASYILDINYSIYDFSEVLRIEQKRTILNLIEKVLNPTVDIVPLSIGQDVKTAREEFHEIIRNFNNTIGLDIKENEVELLLETLINPYYYPAFIESNDLHKVMTVFGAKGLEFNQVLSFASYYNFVEEERKNNHYVCVTRAEDKFIMFENITSNYTEDFNNFIKEIKKNDLKYLYKIIDHTI